MAIKARENVPAEVCQQRQEVVRDSDQQRCDSSTQKCQVTSAFVSDKAQEKAAEGAVEAEIESECCDDTGAQ